MRIILWIFLAKFQIVVVSSILWGRALILGHNGFRQLGKTLASSSFDTSEWRQEDIQRWFDEDIECEKSEGKLFMQSCLSFPPSPLR